MRNQDLAKIVERVQKNKDKHFEELYGAIGKTIYYMSYKLLKDSHEAEDSTQEIMLYIYSHIEELRAPEAFNQWMNRIIFGICNRIMDKTVRFKESLKGQGMEVESKGDDEEQVEEFIIQEEEKKILIKIIKNLSSKQREVLLMYYYQSMTALEISFILGCSEMAVRSRLFKAKKAISKELKKKGVEKREELYSIGIVPFIITILKMESEDIYTKTLQEKMWRQFLKVKETGSQKQEQIMKKNHIKGIVIGICFVAILMITGISIANMKQKQNKTKAILLTVEEKDKMEETFAENKVFSSEEEEVNQKEYDLKESESQENESTRNETTKQKKDESEGKGSLVPEQSEDFEENQSSAITKGRQTFDNEAYLVDKDLEGLEYEENVNEEKKGDKVYEEEAIVESETLYHVAVLPELRYRKFANNRENQLVTEDDIITYSIEVVNEGEIPASKILIQDPIPQNTTYIQGSVTSDNKNVESLETEMNVLFLIKNLQPKESVIVSFQVRVGVIAKNEERYIRNIASIYYIPRNQEIDQLSSEHWYGETNEWRNGQKGKESKGIRTGDNWKLEIFSLVLIISVGVTLIFWKKQGENNGQENMERKNNKL